MKEALEKTIASTARAPLTGADRLRLVTGVDFDLIVRENSKRLFNIAWHMLGNTQEAEEMVQEIFLEAYMSLPGYKGDAPVSNWLYRIAMNTLADHVREKKRKPRVAADFSGNARDRTGATPSGSISAEDEYLKTAAMEGIRKAALALPERHRAVFVLNVVEGRSHKEIAGILGISPGAARVIRVRAARMIKKEIMKHELKGGGNGDEMQVQ